MDHMSPVVLTLNLQSLHLLSSLHGMMQIFNTNLIFHSFVVRASNHTQGDIRILAQDERVEAADAHIFISDSSPHIQALTRRR